MDVMRQIQKEEISPDLREGDPGATELDNEVND